MKETRKGNLLFVGGDLSGIQKFIYNVSSKKAAVSLKGRSEYLSRYTKDLHDALCNIPCIAKDGAESVYCSSGKFYVITPDTAECRAAIEQFCQERQTELWQDQHGQLSMSICYVPFTMADDGKEVIVNGQIGSIGLLWNAITPLFAAAKKRAFEHILLQQFDTMFTPAEVGGNVHVCAITGIESNACIPMANGDNNDIFVLPSVKKQIDLGEALRDKEHFKTFEEYAHNTHLGVLRMDVDGLGSRFIKGFEDFSEYTQFSDKLKTFFSDNIYVLQARPSYKPHLNIIYAGGDDLFVVGRWDKVIDFAADVQKQFAQFMQGEELSISGGIAIVDAKFPIAKAAQLSGEAEECAKNFETSDGKKKNAICFFGQSVSWSVEYPFVLQLKNELVDNILHHHVSKGLLHQLMQYAQMAQRGEQRYVWHSTYYLTRMLKETKDDTAKTLLTNLRNQHMTQGLRHVQLIALAARWAEQELRIH